MRINNPEKFTADGRNGELVSISEVKDLTKFQYSTNNIDWHDNKEDDDIFIRCSFNGGESYPLFFTSQMNDEIIIKNYGGELFDWPEDTDFHSKSIVLNGINACPILSAIIENDPSILIDIEDGNKAIDFILSNYIKGLSLIRQEADGYSYVELMNQISYNFIIDNKDNQGNIKLQYYFKPIENLQNRKYLLKIKLNTNKINENTIIADFKVPVYASNITAIPTVYNDNYGICNYLNRNENSLTNKITLTSRFNQVSRISLYVVSADNNITGNVKLNVKIGNYLTEAVCSVSNEPSWIYISNTGLASGEISINRIPDNEDTLIDSLTGNGIDCIILGIRVETE